MDKIKNNKKLVLTFAGIMAVIAICLFMIFVIGPVWVKVEVEPELSIEVTPAETDENDDIIDESLTYDEYENSDKTDSDKTGQDSVDEEDTTKIELSEDTLAWIENGAKFLCSGEIVIPYSMDGAVYFATLDHYSNNPAVMIKSIVGQPILSMISGTVVDILENEYIGNAVVIESDDISVTYGLLYASNDIEVGTTINVGDFIGRTSEPTKHYAIEGTIQYIMITENGEPIDPVEFYNNTGLEKYVTNAQGWNESEYNDVVVPWTEPAETEALTSLGLHRWNGQRMSGEWGVCYWYEEQQVLEILDIKYSNDYERTDYPWFTMYNPADGQDIPGVYEATSTYQRSIAPKVVIIGYDAEKIPDNCFMYNTMEAIVLPDSCAEIGQYCFARCENLTMINTENVSKFGNYCFIDCKSLKEVSLNSVTEIGEKCFASECYLIVDATNLDLMTTLYNSGYTYNLKNKHTGSAIYKDKDDNLYEHYDGEVKRYYIVDGEYVNIDVPEGTGRWIDGSYRLRETQWSNKKNKIIGGYTDDNGSFAEYENW